MRVLAVVVQHNLVIICPNGVLLFLKDIYDKHDGIEASPSRSYPAKYAKLSRDLPSEVLHQDTWYLVFDGVNHYWPAFRSTDVPSTADVETAGFVLDFTKCKHIFYLGEDPTRKSVRLQGDRAR